MINTKNATRNDEVRVDPIASASPFLFVISCLMLAYMYAVPLSTYPSEWLEVAESLYSASKAMWLALPMSLLMMFTLGLPPMKNQIAAFVLGLIGSLVILAMAAFQFSWLVMMILIFAVIIPAGNIAFSKMTSN